VEEEELVFGRDGRPQKVGRDLSEPDPAAAAALIGKHLPKESSVPIQEAERNHVPGAEPALGKWQEDRKGDDPREGEENEQEPLLHFERATWITFSGLRPNTSGAYISKARVPGRTKLPKLTARAK
jgi:hypothetical protein